MAGSQLMMCGPQMGGQLCGHEVRRDKRGFLFASVRWIGESDLLSKTVIAIALGVYRLPRRPCIGTPRLLVLGLLLPPHT